MKKFISVMLASVLSITSLGMTAFAGEAAEDKDAELASTFVSQITENGSKIPNTYARMKKGENVNLGYFGGSVTNGYAKANPPYNPTAPSQGVNCWRGLSQRWLQSEYGTANGMTFAETNSNGTIGHAGLGGTGIDLNLFRADRWLGLSSGDPVDLLFIEFSINDSYEQNTYEKSAFFMESAIKMIREKSPTTDIVVMLTTDHSKLSASSGGTVMHKNAQAHVDVAEHYGIPWFWFGEYMYDFLVTENEKLGNGKVLPGSGSELWQTYMADGCHPSVQGYKKYFEFLRDNFLIPNLDDTKGYSTEIVSYTTPATPYNATEKFLSQNSAFESGANSVYYNQRLRSDASYIFPSQTENFGTSGYGYEIYNPGGTSYMYSSNPGMSFTVKFNSRNAGMFYKGHNTMGLIQYRVDGGEWQYKNMYMSSTNQHEYFMFYENAEEKEHTVDVILRKTSYGVDLEFRGFFVEGDSTNYGAKLASGAPNNVPLPENVEVPKVLAPADLNTVIQGGGVVNDGAKLLPYHLGVIDKDVLRYIPNPDSSYAVASDCYNSSLHAVTLPKYRYAVVKYYYELEPGTTTASVEGGRQLFNFKQRRNSADSNHSQAIQSADKIVLGGITANQSLFDVYAVCARNKMYEGYLYQFHFYPFGNVKGSDLVSTELMNIESVSFYAEYPYTDEYTIAVPVDKAVRAETTVDLSGKRILPSAHRYATIKYTADADANVTLAFKGLYGGDYTVSKKATAAAGEVIISLEKIAESGQTFFYENVSLSADSEIDVESITFDVNYPRPDAEFEITFDANGGTGEVPAPIKGKIDTKITLPNADMADGNKLFLGWSTTKDGSDIVTEIKMPADGITLYAAYADAALLTYDLNGGSASIPSAIKVAVGKETSLISGTPVTKGDSVFVGWGTSKDATATVDKITMDADGVTVYAIFKDIQKVYVAADGKVNYGGTEYTADYTSIADAISALGTSGGHIIFEGIFPGTTKIGVKGAPLYIYEGADNTAGLTFTGYTVDFTCNTKLKNMAFLRYSEDPYFYANGYSLTFDEGFGFYAYDDAATNKRGTETGLKGGLRGGKAVMNDGKLASFFTGGNYNGNSSGNTYMEFNGGEHYGFTMGSYYFDQFAANSYTHTGNATVVINGGEFSSKVVKVDHNSKFPTTVTGATTVILNNGISGFTFDSKIKYIIKSAAGGTVTLAADGTSSYAPTLFVKAKNPESTILINGEEVPAENGEYLFMPKGTGTYNITYKAGTKAYANADGSGKLTVDGKEYKAYDTILEAMSTLDSTGGTVYFSGTHADMTSIIAATSGMEAITFRGVDENSRIQFPKNVNLNADTTFENMNFITTEGGATSPYIYASGHKLTIGKLGDAVQPARLKYDGSAGGVETLGGTGKASEFVINGGSFANLGLVEWGAGSHNKDVILTINGGTINPAAIRTNYTGTTNVSANLIFTINGGDFHTSTVLDPKANVSGNSILILNNDYADKLSTTAFKYVIDAPAGIKVEAVSLGNATTAPTFKLTPAEGIEKVFVNRGEIAAKDGVYTYTPSTTGNFIVEADLTLPAATFVKGEGETGDVPAPITGEVDADVVIPSCTLAKEGYRLAGWATSANQTTPEFTTTFKMPEGGITLYPVWRDAETIFVSPTGKITYNGVEYLADYKDLIEAQTARAEAKTTFVFTGMFDLYKVMDQTYGKSPYVAFEGVGEDSILYVGPATSAVNVKPYAATVVFKNVNILRRRGNNNGTEYTTDLYFNGNGKNIVFDYGTKVFAEDGVGSGKLGAEIEYKGYSFGSLTVNSGKTSDQLHLTAITSDSSGNRYYEIGGTAAPYSNIHLGTLDWNNATRTHTGNITLVINGGIFDTAHSIRVDQQSGKITNVTGAVSVIINNGIADEATFTIDPKVEYVIKSAAGGTVSLAGEGSETTAPTFNIATNARNNILVNGEVVSENGLYSFKPTDKGTYNVTYEKRPVNVSVEIIANLVSGSGSAIVDTETGFDGNAYIAFDGEERIALTEITGGASKTFNLGEGEHSFKITKNGYISYEGTITVDADGNISGLREIDLIAGDIKASFNASEGDGKVDLDDFIRVLRGFNNLGEENELLRQIVDINSDGSVNVSDLAAIKLNYGKTAASYNEAE